MIEINVYITQQQQNIISGFFNIIANGLSKKSEEASQISNITEGSVLVEKGSPMFDLFNNSIKYFSTIYSGNYNDLKEKGRSLIINLNGYYQKKLIDSEPIIDSVKKIIDYFIPKPGLDIRELENLLETIDKEKLENEINTYTSKIAEVETNLQNIAKEIIKNDNSGTRKHMIVKSLSNYKSVMNEINNKIETNKIGFNSEEGKKILLLLHNFSILTTVIGIFKNNEKKIINTEFETLLDAIESITNALKEINEKNSGGSNMNKSKKKQMMEIKKLIHLINKKSKAE